MEMISASIEETQQMEMMAKKEEDRISSLPDDILSHILSFVELREAVKTTILSKRWEKVWTSIRRIYLNNQSCLNEFNHDLSLEEEYKRRTSFINFVNEILSGNNSRILSVTSFCLSYFVGFPHETIDEEIPYVIQWIAAAITPNLENFDFGIAFRCFFPSIKMPRTLFQCQKLVTLKLNSTYSNRIYLDVPETVCLSSLEKLRLVNVQFKDENSLKNILSGCPVLEELYMGEIDNPYGVKHNLFVFSPSLKILRVDNSACSSHFGNCYVVEAPKLEYLNFVEHSLSGFTMTASPSLVSAVIDICICLDYSSPLSVIVLFQGISNVQNLELSTHGTTMLKDDLANLPELHNLVHLKIGRCKNRDIIPCILQRSPHLKHLIFDELLFSSKAFMWSPPEWVPKCLTLHLEMIEIGLVWRKEEEAMKMIEYLLDKGKVLKKMTITPFPDEEVFNDLMGFTRASVGCEIGFS